MATHVHTTRRLMLKALPAAAIAFPAATCAASHHIDRLFEQWRGLRARIGGVTSDEGLEAMMGEVSRLEGEFFACPSDSARAVQIKVAVTDADGQLTGSNAEIELARQAWAALEA